MLYDSKGGGGGGPKCVCPPVVADPRSIFMRPVIILTKLLNGIRARINIV